jgi:glycerophosphoryl diester phosphodiesterase
MPLLDSERSNRKINRRPMVIAHRGASGLAPENTPAAFKLAIALGADGVEMDVQMSSDNRAVVIHDWRVNRTTDGRGPVSLLTSDQLARLDAGSWFDHKLTIRPRLRAQLEREARISINGNRLYAGEPVPTLEATLALLAPANLRRVYIELKSAAATREALLSEVVAFVRAFRMERAVTLLSFDHEAVKEAKRVAPDIRAAATFPIAGRALASVRSILAAVESLGADEAALHFGLATRRTVAALHEKGFLVSAWTANSPLVFRRLINSRVDAIMTNFPNRLFSTLDATGPRLSRKLRRNGN